MSEKVNSENNNVKGTDLAWFPVFETLSMDCVTDFLRDSGLNLIHSDSLKEICRYFIRSYYDNSKTMKELLAVTLENLKNLLGEEGLDEIQEWGKSNHENSNEQNGLARDWVILLGRLANFFAVENYPLAPINLPENKVMLLRIAFLTYIANVYRFRFHICEAKNKSLSEWDSYVYSKHTEGSDPLTWLINRVIFTYRVSQWKQIQASLTSPIEIKALEEWGANQAKIMGQEIPHFVHFSS